MLKKCRCFVAICIRLAVNLAINANLGREVKAGDLTKEDSPWWGTFDYRQVPGGGDN